MFGAERWMLTKNLKTEIQEAERRCLCKVKDTRRRSGKRNEEVRKELNIRPVTINRYGRTTATIVWTFDTHGK